MELNETAHLEEVLSLLSGAVDDEYIGEDVTQLEHALQCAHFAQQARADDEMIMAALFHDIGHICAEATSPQMKNLGVAHHEDIGSSFLLRKGFSKRVAALVGGHVRAKRYLVSRNPAYYERLSEASKETLKFQGGVMSRAEALQFEGELHFKEILQIRAWDEMAKIKDLKVPNLEHYRTMINNHLALLNTPP